MGNKLKEVTYLTAKDLKKYEIVLPSRYSKTFEKFAGKMEVELENEEVLLKDLSDGFDHIDKIVRKTNENLSYLSESASNAQVAIDKKDKKGLASIKEELELMKKKIEFLQKELFCDPLTGAYNRKWFIDDFLEDGKFKSNGFIVFLDLNKFKVINDTYGHLAGDQVLKYLVKFLNKEITEFNKNIIRYSGDEFIIIFNEEEPKFSDVKVRMHELQEKLANQKLKSSKIESLQFSFSYGIYKFKSGNNSEEIIDRVDELMYKNKEKTR